jgi:hypothetical protein
MIDLVSPVDLGSVRGLFLSAGRHGLEAADPV